MPYHPIKVDRENEKRLYNICKELELNFEKEININNKEWHGTLRKFGIRAKPLIETELIDPIWKIEAHSRNSDKRLIRISKENGKPKGCLKEVKKGKKSNFWFKLYKK